MEKAIKKAIKGGYTECCIEKDGNINYMFMTAHEERILLDHLFWVALIKQLAEEHKGIPVKRSGATFMQHDFIDHIAEGKNIDKFFENLLT